MKKLLSTALAAAMVVSCSAAVMAEDKTPTVFVNTSEIMFEDQTPVILGSGTTLVPARGVFEAMGASVKWDEAKREVEVESADHKTLVRLTIDDSTMRVYDLSNMLGSIFAGEDFNAPETDVTLEVAPQILNERTMIPLRAISEALKADVQWNGEAYTIDITTADKPASTANLPALSLSAPSLTVKEGEDAVLYVQVSNMPADTYVSAASAVINYDKENFEFVSASLVNGEADIESVIGASNPEFGENGVKSAFVIVNAEDAAVKSDGNILKFVFKSLTGKEGVFTLSNGYHTKVGYHTGVQLSKINAKEGEAADIMYDGTSLAINNANVTINALGAPAESVTTPDADQTAPETTPVPSEAADGSDTANDSAKPVETPTDTPAVPAN